MNARLLSMIKGRQAFDKLDSISFDHFLTRQDPFGAAKPLIDLQGIRLVSPAGLVKLAATVHAIARDGRTATITKASESVRTYLIRSGFVSVVAAVSDFDPPSPPHMPNFFERIRGSNPLLIEVTKLESGTALPKVLDQIVGVLNRRFRYPKYDAFDAATAVSEIAQNTFDHNKDACGFLAMQVYGTGPKRFLEIGVSDFGDGVAATLMRNPKNGSIKSDAQAIRLATQLGISAFDEPTRGTGLFHLLQIAFRHEGSLQIWSGRAKMRYRMDTKKGWEFTVPHLPGMHVTMTLRSKSSHHRRANKVA
jgi:hypothetical protein